MENFYSRKYYIEDYMCDRNGCLLPSFALKLVQSVSVSHCKDMGVFEKISQRKQVFLISKQVCSFDRQIMADEIITLHSAPLQTSRGSFPRMTYFKDGDGKTVGHCDARWFLFDFANKRLMRKMDEDICYPVVTDIMLEPIIFPKLETEFLRDEVVRYTQFDTNGHLNNTEYLNYLSDTVLDAPISSFQVNYRKEITGGNVRLEVCKNQNEIYLAGFCEDTKNFEILATIKE